jgi:hypothetical protein
MTSGAIGGSGLIFIFFGGGEGGKVRIFANFQQKIEFSLKTNVLVPTTFAKFSIA